MKILLYFFLNPSEYLQTKHTNAYIPHAHAHVPRIFQTNVSLEN